MDTYLQLLMQRSLHWLYKKTIMADGGGQMGDACVDFLFGKCVGIHKDVLMLANICIKERCFSKAFVLCNLHWSTLNVVLY